MIITLSADEVAMAAAVAVNRGLEAIKLNRRNNHGFVGNGWTENIGIITWTRTAKGNYLGTPITPFDSLNTLAKM